MGKKADNMKRTLAQIASSIRKRSQSLADILAIGADLTEAKALMRKLQGHGDWLGWLDREVDFSLRSAENYMAAHRFASRNAAVAKSKLTPSALYWLSTAELPVNVVAKILRRARDYRITESDALAIAREMMASEIVTRAEKVAAEAKREAEEREEAATILEEPPPDLPPQKAAPSEPLPTLMASADELLSDFDLAVNILKRASAKPSDRFQGMLCSPADLRAAAEFLNYLADTFATKAAA
jgi:hypothetical protein